MSKIKVRVHKAFFVEDPTKTEYYFINIRNTYKHKGIHIRGINFFGRNDLKLTVHQNIFNSTTPLPLYLQAGKEWETYVAVLNIPLKNSFNNFMVRYTKGAYKERYKVSKKRHFVPKSGQVPNGQ